MGKTRAKPVASPCLLKRKVSSFFSASAGTVTLTLTDKAGTTVFDCARCVLTDTTVAPGKTVPITCTAPAQQISFAVTQGRMYVLQLAFIQVPTPGSSADLRESPCAQLLDTVDPTNQILVWNIQA